MKYLPLMGGRAALLALHALRVLQGGHALSSRLLSTSRKAFGSPPTFTEASVESQNVAVCIAGQLQRLEIETKVKNILIPLAQKRHLVHVFLALETGEAQFVNLPNTANSTVTKEDIQRKLNPFYKAGYFQQHVNYTADPSRWTAYLKDGKPLNRTQRLGLHMSEQTNLKRCIELIQNSESRLGFHYDVVVKLRDNTLVPQPFTLLSANDIDKRSDGDSILVKNCAGWGGLSNKVMVLPRKYLSIALGGVHDALRGIQTGRFDKFGELAFDSTVLNDELLLKRVLQSNKVPYLEVNSTVLPFVDGRLSNDGSGVTWWCPVAEEKDCWPPGPWNAGDEVSWSCDVGSGFSL